MKRSLLDLVRKPFAFLCKSRPPPWLRPHPQLPLGLTQSEPFLEQNHQKIHFSERSLPEHQNQRNWYHSDPLFKTEVPPTSRQHPISMLRVSLQSILSSTFRSLSAFVSSDTMMVFVYILTFAGEAPQWGPSIRLIHFGVLDKPSNSFLELVVIETRSFQ